MYDMEINESRAAIRLQKTKRRFHQDARGLFTSKRLCHSSNQGMLRQCVAGTLLAPGGPGGALMSPAAT